MSRITIPARDDVQDRSKPILDAVTKQLGFAPNLHRLISLSPPTLAGWLGLQTELAKTLDARTRAAIALAVSEADDCAYCLAAHSYVAENFARMSPAEIKLNRDGRSGDPRPGAAARFAKSLIETRGHVDDNTIEAVHAAGFSDAQIIEITALAAQFLLTNFINNMASTAIDFPRVSAPLSTAR
jgi:uncharacterized peroxidase-related enzyme